MSDANERINGRELFLHLKDQKQLKEVLRNAANSIKIKNSNLDFSLSPEDEKILRMMGGVPDLLIYAQRKYFCSEFPEDELELDDTNSPFDWDHLFPQSWIAHHHNIAEVLKHWHGSFGNFRITTYSLNRLRGNSPLDNLSDNDRENYFLKT